MGHLLIPNPLSHSVTITTIITKCEYRRKLLCKIYKLLVAAIVEVQDRDLQPKAAHAHVAQHV